MDIFRSICNYIWDTELWISTISWTKQFESKILSFSFFMRVKLITYHHIFFLLQENLFHLHLGRLPWFTWEYTPKQRKKHLNQSIMFSFKLLIFGEKYVESRNWKKPIGGAVPWWWICLWPQVCQWGHWSTSKWRSWQGWGMGRHASNRWNCISELAWLYTELAKAHLVEESLWTNSYNKITPTLGCFFFFQLD